MMSRFDGDFQEEMANMPQHGVRGEDDFGGASSTGISLSQNSIPVLSMQASLSRDDHQPLDSSIPVLTQYSFPDEDLNGEEAEGTKPSTYCESQSLLDGYVFSSQCSSGDDHTPAQYSLPTKNLESLYVEVSAVKAINKSDNPSQSLLNDHRSTSTFAAGIVHDRGGIYEKEATITAYDHQPDLANPIEQSFVFQLMEANHRGNEVLRELCYSDFLGEFTFEGFNHALGSLDTLVNKLATLQEFSLAFETVPLGILKRHNNLYQAFEASTAKANEYIKERLEIMVKLGEIQKLLEANDEYDHLGLVEEFQLSTRRERLFEVLKKLCIRQCEEIKIKLSSVDPMQEALPGSTVDDHSMGDSENTLRVDDHHTDLSQNGPCVLNTRSDGESEARGDGHRTSGSTRIENDEDDYEFFDVDMVETSGVDDDDSFTGGLLEENGDDDDDSFTGGMLEESAEDDVHSSTRDMVRESADYDHSPSENHMTGVSEGSSNGGQMNGHILITSDGNTEATSGIALNCNPPLTNAMLDNVSVGEAVCQSEKIMLLGALVGAEETLIPTSTSELVSSTNTFPSDDYDDELMIIANDLENNMAAEVALEVDCARGSYKGLKASNVKEHHVMPLKKLPKTKAEKLAMIGAPLKNKITNFTLKLPKAQALIENPRKRPIVLDSVDLSPSKKAKTVDNDAGQQTSFRVDNPFETSVSLQFDDHPTTESQLLQVDSVLPNSMLACDDHHQASVSKSPCQDFGLKFDKQYKEACSRAMTLLMEFSNDQSVPTNTNEFSIALSRLASIRQRMDIIELFTSSYDHTSLDAMSQRRCRRVNFFLHTLQAFEKEQRDLLEKSFHARTKLDTSTTVVGTIAWYKRLNSRTAVLQQAYKRHMQKSKEVISGQNFEELKNDTVTLIRLIDEPQMDIDDHHNFTPDIGDRQLQRNGISTTSITTLPTAIPKSMKHPRLNSKRRRQVRIQNEMIISNEDSVPAKHSDQKRTRKRPLDHQKSEIIPIKMGRGDINVVHESSHKSIQSSRKGNTFKTDLHLDVKRAGTNGVNLTKEKTSEILLSGIVEEDDISLITVSSENDENDIKDVCKLKCPFCESWWNHYDTLMFYHMKKKHPAIHKDKSKWKNLSIERAIFRTEYLRNDNANKGKVYYECPYSDCKSLITSRENLVRHTRSKHDGKTMSRNSRRKVEYRLDTKMDPIVPQVYIDKRRTFRENGIDVIFINGKFQCPSCAFVGDSDNDVKGHIKRVHIKNQRTQCPVCNKPTSKHYLPVHMKKVHPQHQNFTCNTCKKGFFSLLDLNNHRKSCVHLGGYQCKKCGKNFSRREILTRHEKICMSQRKDTWECDICGRVFKWKANYINHMGLHNDQQTKSGVVLDKQQYKNESEVHTYVDNWNKRVRKCEKCGTRFYDKDAHADHLIDYHLHLIQNQFDALKRAQTKEFHSIQSKGDREKFQNVYAQSRRLMPLKINKLYWLVFVPKHVTEDRLYDHIQSNGNFLIYCGKKSEIEGISKHHCSPSSANYVATHYLAAGGWNCYHIHEKFIEQESGLTHAESLAKAESIAILKLFLFSVHYGREMFCQLNELGLLKKHMTRKILRSIVDDVRKANGNVFKLMDLKFSFSHKYDVEPASKAAVAKLSCTKCKSQFYNIHLSRLHSITCAQKPSDDHQLLRIKSTDIEEVFSAINLYQVKSPIQTVYSVVSLQEKLTKQALEEKLSTTSSVNVYIGESAGNSIAEYHHKRSESSSALKREYNKGNQLYFIRKWTTETASEKFRLERALIIIQYLREAMEHTTKVKMLNSVIITQDISELFTEEEWMSLFDYATGDECFISSGRVPGFFKVKTYTLMQDITSKFKNIN